MLKTSRKFSPVALLLSAILAGIYFVKDYKPPPVDPRQRYGDNVSDEELHRLCESLPAAWFDFDFRPVGPSAQCTCFLTSDEFARLGPQDRLGIAGAWLNAARRIRKTVLLTDSALFSGYHSNKIFFVSYAWARCIPSKRRSE